MAVVIIEAVLTVLCVLRLFIPISVGVAINNIYLFMLHGVSINFVFIWSIMMFILVIFHLIGIRQKRTFSDLKADILMISATVITLAISIL